MVAIATANWLAPPDQPWEYRHLRAFGRARLRRQRRAARAICLAYDADGWAAFFLAIGSLNIAGGYWYLTIDRSAAPRA